MAPAERRPRLTRFYESRSTSRRSSASWNDAADGADLREAVVTLEASGGPHGITFSSKTQAGVAVVEELRAGLDEATRARSGGPEGTLLVGCAVGGKAALVEWVEAWLVAEGATARRG